LANGLKNVPYYPVSSFSNRSVANISNHSVAQENPDIFFGPSNFGIPGIIWLKQKIKKMKDFMFLFRLPNNTTSYHIEASIAIWHLRQHIFPKNEKRFSVIEICCCY
jgi:hypothetical protein